VTGGALIRAATGSVALTIADAERGTTGGPMGHRDDRTRDQAERHALFEELRALLYRLPEGHPARPGLHAAAVAAYCHWREAMAPPTAPPDAAQGVCVAE